MPDLGEDIPIKLTGVSQSFGKVNVIDNLSLEVKRGEFVVIVGPSGCGKTTLLHVLAGHFQPTSGTVERSGLIRTIYQQDGLFPWLTVEENIDMGLRKITDPSERTKQRKELLELIRLQDFQDHYPHQISGGMKQRVELARAMAGNSDVLLMDEPFSALDFQTRLRIRRELVRLLNERPRTVVFVTHDIAEAAQLADRILVLSERPAHITDEICVTTPRPRDLTNPDVIRTIEKLTNDLGLYETETDVIALNKGALNGKSKSVSKLTK